MAIEKQMKVVLQNKHDTPANWDRAGRAIKPFVPKQGEIIVYDDRTLKTNNSGEVITDEIVSDKIRYKIGDGVTNINLLPFANPEDVAAILAAGTGTSSIQQFADGVQDGFDFTGKNENATYHDPSLTGTIPYGATGAFASSFGGKSAAMGKRSHSEGTTTIAKGAYSHAEGDNSVTIGADSHAEGYKTTAVGEGSHTEGARTVAIGKYSHVEGIDSNVSGLAAHAEGYTTYANAPYSHAEGQHTTTDGNASHTEGADTWAWGFASHAEGSGSQSEGESSHAEGNRTHAKGNFSHTEGNNTYAGVNDSNEFFGESAHAEGENTHAYGYASHTEGIGTEAYGEAQHVQGKYNIDDPEGRYAHIVGNGTGNDEYGQSNAHTLDWQGNAWFAGNVYVGENGQDEGKKLLTEEDLPEIPKPLETYEETEDDVSIRVPGGAIYTFSKQGFQFSPSGPDYEFTISAYNAYGKGQLHTDLQNGDLKYTAECYAGDSSDNIIYSGTKTIAFKEDINSEFDLMIETEEDLRKCFYMLHSVNADGSLDLTTTNEPNPDFNYKYILVKNIDFTTNLGTSDLNLAIIQPSIRYIKFDNCQWHCQWWVSGEKPTTLKYDNNGVPTEYEKAPGNFHVILDGINISEQNVIDSYPTAEDPDRYYYVGLRNIERIENCFIDYPSDYALIENFNEDGSSAGFSYTFKFNLQYFDCVQNCKITALWDGANVSNCRVSERIVRCTNCSNIIGEPIYRDGALYRVQMRESQGLSNISGSPIIYTSCSRVDESTCAEYGGSKNPEYDLIISTVNELKELPNNTTATSVLVAIPGRISATARVPGFFDNDSSNAPYFSKFIIPKNVKYIKFADCFGGITAPRVIIQGHENCVIDGLPTLDAPFYYSNCETIYNFKEARNCKTRNWQLSPALKPQKIDLSKTSAGTINAEGWLQDNTDYTVTFTLNCVNATVGSVVFRTDADDRVIGNSLSQNKSYSFTFNSGLKANTGSFYFDCALIDATKTGSVTVSPITIARADKQFIFTTRVHGLSNVLSWGPDISQYPELGPDIAEQKTKFINCDLGTINGAAAIENCTVCSQSNTMKNVNRISGLTIQYCSSSNNFILSNCSNLSSINHGNGTITYTNCTKIDANSCDDATEITLTGYATTEYVDEAVKNVKVDLTGYATETYVNNKIANCATKDDIGNINNILLALHEGGI